MNKSIWALHKESLILVWKGIKNNFISYLICLVVSLVALSTIILAPFAVRALIGMHEMLIADGKIDYRKLLTQIDDDKNYFKILLVILVESVIVMTGFAFFVVPGVFLALALMPVNYLLYKGKAPKISVLIPASVDLMKGKKTKLFLAYLVLFGAYMIVYAVFGIVLFLLAQVAMILTLPIAIILLAVSLFAVMDFLMLTVIYARSLTEVTEQPVITA